MLLEVPFPSSLPTYLTHPAFDGFGVDEFPTTHRTSTMMMDGDIGRKSLLLVKDVPIPSEGTEVQIPLDPNTLLGLPEDVVHVVIHDHPEILHGDVSGILRVGDTRPHVEQLEVLLVLLNLKDKMFSRLFTDEGEERPTSKNEGNDLLQRG